MNLSVKSDALEIWVGWNGTKWVFLKRRTPDKTALRHLQRFAGPLKAIAPSWMQDKPDQPDTHKTLEHIVYGSSLFPIAAKIATFRKDDTFRVSFTPEGKIRIHESDLPSTWVMVSAVQGDLRLKVKPTLQLPAILGDKARELYKLGTTSELLELKGITLDAPSAASAAGLFAPANDPSPHSGRRPRAGDSGPPGQTDLWET